MRFMLAALCGLFFATFAQAGDYTVTMGARSFLVHTPPNPNGAAVIVLHGRGQSAAQYASGDPVGMRAASDADGFTAVYPQADGIRWNDSDQDTTDDVGYIRDVVAAITSMPEFNVDRARIFIAGVSNGGMMTQRIACEMNLAGHVVVAATLPVPIRDMCGTPANPAPMVIFMGTADESVPFNGGSVGFFPRKALLSANESWKYWTRAAGCPTALRTPTVTNMPNLSPSDGTTVKRKTYGCQVTFYEIANGGHTWPGYPGGNGLVSYDINATNIMLKAFGLR